MSNQMTECIAQMNILCSTEVIESQKIGDCLYEYND